MFICRFTVTCCAAVRDKRRSATCTFSLYSQVGVTDRYYRKIGDPSDRRSIIYRAVRSYGTLHLGSLLALLPADGSGAGQQVGHGRGLRDRSRHAGAGRPDRGRAIQNSCIKPYFNPESAYISCVYLRNDRALQ